MRPLQAAALAAVVLVSSTGCVFTKHSLEDSAQPQRNQIDLSKDAHHIYAEVVGTDSPVSLFQSGNVLFDAQFNICEPLELEMEEPISGTLVYYYNADELGDMPEENLMILYYNEDDEESVMAEPIECDVDTEKQSVSVPVPGNGTYMLVDVYAWLGVLGVDLSDSDLAYDTTFTCSEYGFTITVPKEVQYTECADYFHDDNGGGEEKDLIYPYENDHLNMELKYKRLAMTYEENMDGLTEALEESDVFTLHLHEIKKMVGGGRADFLLIESESGFQYSGFYQYEEDEFVFLSYSFTDREAYGETVRNSLYSFRRKNIE